MHVGFLTPEYVTPGQVDGGLANYLRKTSLALADRGHRVSVLVLSNRDAIWQDESIAVCEVKRVVWPNRLRRIQTLRPFLPATGQILSSRRLERLVRKNHLEASFDILQASSYLAPGFSLLGNRQIPLVCRISSYTPLWRSALGRQRSLADFLCDWLEIRQVRDAEASFAPSRFMADTYARLEGYRPQVIRTPLDTSNVEMDPSYYQTHLSGKSYLLFFGTLNGVKGADLLGEAIPVVLAKHSELAFVLVGRNGRVPNGQRAMDYIRSRCQGLEQRLHHFPVLPKTALYPIVANAVGVVAPSRVDNYPNVCLEAQSMGVPVVGTYHSSLDEMIVEGETGFLASNNDPASLCASMERLLLMTPTQRREMQKRILDSVRAVASEDRVGELISFYDAAVTRFWQGRDRS